MICSVSADPSVGDVINRILLYHGVLDSNIAQQLPMFNSLIQDIISKYVKRDFLVKDKQQTYQQKTQLILDYKTAYTRAVIFYHFLHTIIYSSLWSRQSLQQNELEHLKRYVSRTQALYFHAPSLAQLLFISKKPNLTSQTKTQTGTCPPRAPTAFTKETYTSVSGSAAASASNSATYPCISASPSPSPSSASFSSCVTVSSFPMHYDDLNHTSLKKTTLYAVASELEYQVTAFRQHIAQVLGGDDIEARTRQLVRDINGLESQHQQCIIEIARLNERILDAMYWPWRDLLQIQHQIETKVKPRYLQANNKMIMENSKALTMKSKLLNTQLAVMTYDEKSVAALKKAAKHIDNALQKAEEEYRRIEEKLMQYESIGPSFEALVDEYHKLQKEKDHKAWSLREINN